MVSSGAEPDAFTRAVRTLLAPVVRPEIRLHELAAPRGLAPQSFALGATVLRDGDEAAVGRLILLHDPDGHHAWSGVFRLVSYVTAAVEPEMAADPLLAAVGWNWLLEALEECGAGYGSASGTVTQVTSTRFGDVAGAPVSTDVELRASWSPDSGELGPHLCAWCTLLALTAGLPPVGVRSLAADIR